MRHPQGSAPWGSLGISRGFCPRRGNGDKLAAVVFLLSPLAAPPPSPLEIQVMAELGLPALQRSPG